MRRTTGHRAQVEAAVQAEVADTQIHWQLQEVTSHLGHKHRIRTVLDMGVVVRTLHNMDNTIRNISNLRHRLAAHHHKRKVLVVHTINSAVRNSGFCFG